MPWGSRPVSQTPVFRGDCTSSRRFFCGFHRFGLGRGPLELACQRWSLTIKRVSWLNAVPWSPSPAGWLLQFQRGHGPLWELACLRWSLTITRVNWMSAAHWSPSPASWLLQFQRGRGSLWELACLRWSLTITREIWINAAYLSPSPASWLLQFSAWARPPVGAGLPAMVVNDYACELDKRGALESIASRLAPTVLSWARSLVGAGLPAIEGAAVVGVAGCARSCPGFTCNF
ncbi:UNVERIFIED_ORG: hypothetical protein J2W87_002378 [Pseudomonas putida]|nr:hypothetical protein [Pseudomonas putida]